MLRINLTIDIKNMYTEDYKTLMREIKEDLNKWMENSILSY